MCTTPLLRDAVVRYLRTVDAAGGSPRFAVRRDDHVDALLARWPRENRAVEAELARRLDQLSDASTSAQPPNALRLARWIHDIVDPAQRLRAYVEALAASGEQPAVDDQTERSLPAFALEQTTAEETPQQALDRLRAELALTRDLLPHDPLTGLANPAYLRRRLREEVARGSRALGRFALLLLSCEEAAAQLIRPNLRQYDLCGRLDERTLAVLLPGAQDQQCAAIVARLRASFSDRGFGLCVGAAGWPRDGSTDDALIEHARLTLQRDQQRLRRGEVDFASIPASMVEHHAFADARTTVWFDGAPEGIDLQVFRTAAGLRFRLPLSFLRVGSEIFFAGKEGSTCRGTLTCALLAPSRSKRTPVLQLEIATPLAERGLQPV